MELNEKNRLEIRDLLKHDTSNISSFYNELYEICSSYLDYLKYTTLTINKRKGLYVEFDKLDMNINIDNLIKFVNNNMHMFIEETKENKNSYFKYLILYVFFHELTHLEQGVMAKYGISNYNEINKLYDDINTFKGLSFRLNYLLYATYFSFERNANLCANQELINIVPESYVIPFIRNFIATYALSYEFDKKIITPARLTYKMSMKRYDIISDGIPLKERIYHGLDVTYEEYLEYLECFSLNTEKTTGIKVTLEPGGR